jgi:hypothetical protein
MNHLELMEVLQPEKEPEAEEEEGPMAGMVGAEHIEGEGKVNSVTNPPSSQKLPQHPHNIKQRKKKKGNARATTGTENFFEVCRRIGLPEPGHFKMCYKALDEDIRKLFECPFLKGRNEKDKLGGGMNFSIPKTLKGCRDGVRARREENELPAPVGLMRVAVNMVERDMMRGGGCDKGNANANLSQAIPLQNSPAEGRIWKRPGSPPARQFTTRSGGIEEVKPHRIAHHVTSLTSTHPLHTTCKAKGGWVMHL